MRYIGFQIKSFDDLKRKDWLTKLKAQVLDAQNAVDLEDFYILFCADLVVEHRRLHKKLRNLNAELARQKNVHIVRPEFVHAFVHLPIQRVAAYLKTKLSSEDHVFKEALESLQDFTVTESAILVELAVSYFLEGATEFRIGELHDSSFISAAYENYPRLPLGFFEGTIHRGEVQQYVADEDSFYDDLGTLNTRVFSIDSHNGQIRPFVYSLLPLGALILDGNVRYGYDGDVLREYLLSALLADKIRKAEEFRVWREDAGPELPSTQNTT